MTDVVSLVVNWSTPDDLLRCIKTAEEHEPHRWVVHQNHHDTIDSEPVLRQIEEMLGPRVAMSGSDQNLGHGAGINQAARLAAVTFDPTYFFIVNPDCEWRQPILTRLATFLEADPIRALVGPKQMDGKGRITAAGIVGSGAKPQHRYWHEFDPGNVLARDAMPSVTVAGSAMMIRSEDFFNFGGLLEAKHYYSETWICYHLRAHGRQVWYYGDPWMIHHWHRSSPVGSMLTDGKFEQDKMLFRKMCDTHNPPIERD